MTSIVVAIVCFGLGVLVGRWRRGLDENRGEGAVRRVLTEHFPSLGYHLLNNVTLPTSDGTTQIDHILVSRYGIFVIESKHYTGWIFADAKSPQWTQVLYQKRYKFQNPLHQNRKHVAAVARLLEFLDTSQLHSLVVFTGDAKIKTEVPSGVLALTQLTTYVTNFQDEVLSENRMQFCVGRLECCRMAVTKQTDVEHIAHLRRKFGDAA